MKLMRLKSRARHGLFPALSGGRWPLLDLIRTAADGLYPASGQGRSRKLRYRFYLRCLLYFSATRDWLKFLASEPRLAALLEAAPFLAEKIHRPYYRPDYVARQRLEHLKAHYTLALAHPLGQHLIEALKQPVPLAEFVGKDGSVHQILLAEKDAFRHEGELALRISKDGVGLYHLAFSFTGTAAAPQLNIGCMQGPRPRLGRTAVRDLTKNLHGLWPHKLLLLAAQTLAQAYGAQRIVAVGSQLHLYRHIRKRRAIAQDYDALWEPLGGRRLAHGEYELPLQMPLKSAQEYPSHKRAEAKRRLDLLAAIGPAIAATLQRVEPG
jgi:uncharacterized protein VirK/YbjX